MGLRCVASDGFEIFGAQGCGAFGNYVQGVGRRRMFGFQGRWVLSCLFLLIRGDKNRGEFGEVGRKRF